MFHKVCATDLTKIEVLLYLRCPIERTYGNPMDGYTLATNFMGAAKALQIHLILWVLIAADRYKRRNYRLADWKGTIA